MYGALSRGGEMDAVRVLRPETIEPAIAEESHGPDPVMGVVTQCGLGFWLNSETTPLGPNPRAFGHPGAGGSVGLADPETRVGFGYVMNQFGSRFADTRATRLVDAVYASL